MDFLFCAKISFAQEMNLPPVIPTIASFLGFPLSSPTVSPIQPMPTLPQNNTLPTPLPTAENPIVTSSPTPLESHSPTSTPVHDTPTPTKEPQLIVNMSPTPLLAIPKNTSLVQSIKVQAFAPVAFLRHLIFGDVYASDTASPIFSVILLVIAAVSLGVGLRFLSQDSLINKEMITNIKEHKFFNF